MVSYDGRGLKSMFYIEKGPTKKYPMSTANLRRKAGAWKQQFNTAQTKIPPPVVH